MSNDIDQISEALGKHGSQIAGLKDTMIVNHTAMERKIDKVLDRLDKLNGSVARNSERIEKMEPAVDDYRKTKKSVIRAAIRVLVLTSLAGLGLLTTAHASTIISILKIVSGG